MLLSSLVTATLVLIVSVAVIILLAELYGIWRTKLYSKQGFKPIIYPLIGGYFHLLVKSSTSKVMVEELHRELEEAKSQGRPGIVCSGPTGNAPIILFSDMNLVKEFFLKEVEIAGRHLLGDLKLGIGAFFVSGEYGVEMKKIYSDYFRVSNLELFLNDMNCTIKQAFDMARDDSGISASQTSKAVARSLVDVTTLLLFGGSKDMEVKIGNKSFSEMIVETVETIFSEKVLFNSLNGLFQDLPNRLNLLSGSRFAKANADAVTTTMREYLQNRLKTYKPADKRSRWSWIDIGLEYNFYAEEGKKIPIEMLVGNCNGFFIAGLDTTRNLVEVCLYTLGVREDIQTKLREEIKMLGLEEGKITLDQVETSQLLENFIRECLRICPPVGVSTERMFLKDCSLGKYKFKKGDMVIVPFTFLMWDKEFFKSGSKFDMDSITPENKTRWCPFSLGKRSCSGQLFAMVEAKLILIQILSAYKISPVHQPDDLKITIGFTMRLLNSQVILTKL